MVTHHCCLTVLTVIPCCDFHRFLYIKLHLQKKIVYFVFFVFLTRPIINCPVPFLSKFVVLSVEVGYSFNLFCFPTNQLVCGHIFHSSCKYTWGNLSWFYLFLQNLMLKHCLLFLSMIYYLWQDFYSITNWLIYWGPCRPSWRYLCYRIHAQACTIQVRLKTHAPLFYLCFLVFPWYSWTSSLY